MTEKFVSYRVSLDLLGEDGYGPIECNSRARLDAWLKPDTSLWENTPVDASAKGRLEEVLIHRSVPSLAVNSAPYTPVVLRSHLDFVLFSSIHLSKELDILSGCFVGGEPTVFDVNFTSAKVKENVKYFGGLPRLSTKQDDSWIDFSHSIFDICKRTSLSRQTPPKPINTDVPVVSFQDLEVRKSRPYLDAALPRKLALNCVNYPEFFSFDGVLYFREASVALWERSGPLGLERTTTEIECETRSQATPRHGAC